MLTAQEKSRKVKKGKDFWGPPLWSAIHTLAFCLNPENAEKFEEFLWLMTILLPCDYCKKNLAKKLVKYPPKDYLNSSKRAFLYSYILHDLANQHITMIHPETPKSSPLFDDVKNLYTQGIKGGGPFFWGPIMWAFIHILAAILKQENAEAYKRVLFLLTYLLPDRDSRKILSATLRKYPIDSYLRNNHDAFFYSYMLHDLINRSTKMEKSPPYDSVKSFYFSSLGEECNDCKV